MALILKPNKYFINPATGGTYSDAYLKVGRIIYDRDNKIAEFILLIYNSRNDRLATKLPIFIDKYAATRDEFDESFSPSVLDISNNIVAAIYEFLLRLKDARGTLIYSDWKSDVV